MTREFYEKSRAIWSDSSSRITMRKRIDGFVLRHRNLLCAFTKLFLFFQDVHVCVPKKNAISWTITSFCWEIVQWKESDGNKTNICFVAFESLEMCAFVDKNQVTSFSFHSKFIFHSFHFSSPFDGSMTLTLNWTVTSFSFSENIKQNLSIKLFCGKTFLVDSSLNDSNWTFSIKVIEATIDVTYKFPIICLKQEVWEEFKGEKRNAHKERLNG